VDLVHAVFEPRGAGPHPALVALHGWGANAFDLLGLAPHLCGGRLLVVCPQGPIELTVGPETSGYGWFPLALGQPPDIPAVASAGRLLDKFILSSLDRYPIDPRKLAVAGFSQGGFMAYLLALQRPDRFAAVAVLSSWFAKEIADALKLRPGGAYPPTLIHHGARDELIPVERVRDSAALLAELGVPVTTREFDMGHEINAQSLAHLSSWLRDRLVL
jgi:phospholipase/carboxylesterase